MFNDSPSNTPSEYYGRLNLFYFFVIAIFILFIFRLFHLQIILSDVFRREAQIVSQRSVTIPAERGVIYDRNHDFPLVSNTDWFSVYITPVQAGDLERVVNDISTLLKLDADNLYKKLTSSNIKSYNRYTIAEGVDINTIVRLSENIEKYPGISFTSELRRKYHVGGSISHILGHVGVISSQELEVLYSDRYHRNSQIGKGGIEEEYDYSLRGRDGERFETINVDGDVIESTTNREPETGYDLVLTIDTRLQRLAEKALNGHAGSVVVIRPSTGEILAMVSSPWYEPDVFSNVEEFSKIVNDPDTPLIYRPIQSIYAPASTFKLVLGAAILNESSISPHSPIYCSGTWILGNRQFRCWLPVGHGNENLSDAILNSCNIYFGVVGVRYLGIDTIYQYAREFGFGTLTGIDIPGEIAGTVPNKEWKRQNEGIPWTGGDTLNVSIGQGYLQVTPIQVAVYTSTVVNDGVMYRPRLLKAVVNHKTGETIEEATPVITKKMDIDESTFKHIKDAMRKVVTQGTALYNVYNNVVDIAAKTGTAEIGLANNWNSWFASYAPYETDNPDERIVVVTMTEAKKNEKRVEYDWWAPKAADIIYRGYFAEETYEEVIANYKKRGVWFARGIEISENGSPQ